MSSRALEAGGSDAGRVRVARLVAAAVLLVVFLAPYLVFRHLTSAGRLEGELRSAIAAWSDTAYFVSVGGTEASLLGRWYRITDLTLTPDSARFAFKRQRKDPERTRYRLRVPSIHLTGVDYLALIRGNFAATFASIDSLNLEASLDRTGPLPSKPVPATLPHDWLRSSSASIRIDTLRLSNGVIRYAERSRDGARPGHIRFDRVDVAIRNLSNDRGRQAGSGAAVIELAARIAGSGRVRIRLEYDLGSPELNLRYAGGVAGLDARRLNPTLVDMEGLRIREGVLDSSGST